MTRQSPYPGPSLTFWHIQLILCKLADCSYVCLNFWISVFLLLITSLGLSRRPNCSSPSLWEKPLVSCSYLVLLDFSFNKGRLYFRSCASPTLNITWRTGKNSLEKPENLLTKLASVFFPVKCFHSNVLTPAWGWHWLRVCRQSCIWMLASPWPMFKSFVSLRVYILR